MAGFDSILFDFDGVLVDSEPVHYSCWAEILKVFGIQLDWKQYQKYCIGLHDGEVIGYLAGLAKPRLPADALWAQYGRKRDLFVQRMTEHPPFPPDLMELIKSLGDYRLAVVTSSDRSEVEPVLRAGGLLGVFDAFVFGGDVTERKPSPEPYLLAAERLGAKRPLVVEDSAAGVQSGQSAGFEVLRVQEASQTAKLLQRRLGLFR